MDNGVDSYTVLIHAARVACSPAALAALARAARRFAAWHEIPAQAEHHGLAPLLYRHLRAAEIDLPRPVARKLQALTVRHRHANQVRTAALGEILAALDGAGIAPLVLKGGALAHMIYPRPGLRPMRDLDVLVRRDEAERAQQVLAQMAGAASDTQQELDGGHHLVAGLQRDGLHVSVEIHYSLYGVQREEIEQTTPFQLGAGGPTAHTLGPEEMMWHLCRHAVGHTSVFDSIRLIWVADVVGFAERFVEQIDWARIERDFPVARNVLAIFGTVAPLSAALRRKARLPSLDRAGFDLDFHGWPRSSLAAQREEKGFARIVWDTFRPPEGWLRLHHGLSPAAPLFWYRWVRHPLHILGHVVDLLQKTYLRPRPTSRRMLQ
jgi:hypothetical protein